jgi:murein DD-endopeptidase MepM/ murein hydrolase activator NlpD
MTEQKFNEQKRLGYLGNVIAAADGKIHAMVSDQGDFCTKVNNVLQLGTNWTGGCAEGNCSGNYVVIDHDPTGTLNLVHSVGYRYTSYAHLQTNSNDHLAVGDVVNQGDQIGRIGSSGNSEGPHLHFEVLKEEMTPEDLSINEDTDTQY